MLRRDFRELLEARWAAGLAVCVGLDTEFERIPEAVRGRYPYPADVVVHFNYDIVEATHDLVCAFKPQIAFYEDLGPDGLAALRKTVVRINDVAPDVPVILDAKRGDIGSTNLGYVRMAFEYLEVDAITVNPYLGAEALKPFLEREDKGIIVLCRTSNPGAGEFQDLAVTPSWEDERKWQLPSGPRGEQRPTPMPLYKYVAYRVSREWNKLGNCAVVVGATYPEELREVRKIVGDMPILIPGIGAQGGDLENTVRAGRDNRGRGMIINSARGIIFASDGPYFAQAARRETLQLRNAVNDLLAV